jgi:sugar O-acyltransferase (sialic acid O-acetyltransferase NeuD family)
MMMPRAVMVGIDKDLVDVIVADRIVELVGIFNPRDEGKTLGIPWIGDDAEWPRWSEAHPDVGVIVTVDAPFMRRRLACEYGLDRGMTVIASSAAVSAHAQTGSGCIIQRGVMVSADAVVGHAVKVNIGAQIHHDCRVGSYSTIAPGACLLGTVTVGEQVFIGANATVLPHRRIGSHATVGAGAVVAEDVPDGMTVVGVPARERRPLGANP